MIIGLTGKAGVGKSTIANILVRDYDFVCLPFAAPIKDMLEVLGFTKAELYGDQKQEINSIYGVTPRHAMQTLGTEWGRQLMCEDIWLRAWRRNLYINAHGKNVVVDDVRFENEIAQLRSLGGRIIRLERHDRPELYVGSHASENLSHGHDCKFLIADQAPEETAAAILRWIA